ncbi:MAG: hypothetical protein Q9195_009240 [Heterodermia aff. obscurata]
MTSGQSAGLCVACIALFDASPNVYYEHYKDGVAEVRKAIRAGCVLCAKFWSSLTEQQQAAVEGHHQHQSAEDHATGYFGEKDKKNPKSICFQYGWPTSKWDEGTASNTVTIVWKRFQFIPTKPLDYKVPPLSYSAQNASDYNGVNPQNLTGIASSHSTWSTAEIRLAQCWINVCLKSHRKCHPTQASFIPSRLIDVGTIEDPIIKLCEGTSVAPHAEYTTLSHSWGITASFTLKAANFKDVKNSIPHDALPKTIGDAILITRDLRIKYIWVDSLCIIQDSVEDWARECELMGSIYAGSYCNIAATAAGSNEEGCIFNRDPASVQSIRVRLDIQTLTLPTSDSNYISDIQARRSPSAPQIKEYAIVPDEDAWSLDIGDGPLLQRAWVVQERLLAPRNLHFGKRQIGFECEEWLAYETYPTGFPGNLLSSKQLKQHCSVRTPFVKREDLGVGKIDTMRLAWILVVIEFSKGKLSRAQDKLAAILGVATQIAGKIGSPYVAGLWVDHLLEQLLWRVSARAEELKTYLTPRQAPSWSWAAVNHRVGEIFAFGIFQEKPEFLVSVIAVEGQDTGRLIYQNDAWIRLRGRLFVAFLCEKAHP